MNNNVLFEEESGLNGGDYVEVRSRAEILATLDQNARLNSIPFLPEMFKYCRRQAYIRAKGGSAGGKPNQRAHG